MKDDDMCFLCSYWDASTGIDPDHIELCKTLKCLCVVQGAHVMI